MNHFHHNVPCVDIFEIRSHVDRFQRTFSRTQLVLVNLTNLCHPPMRVLPKMTYLYPPALGPNVVFGLGAMNCSSLAAKGFTAFSPKSQHRHLANANQSVEEQRARHAFADANLIGPGLMAVLTARVAELHIDEQCAFICKIVALLSASVLDSPPPVAASRLKRPLCQRLMGAIKASRRSTRLMCLQSSFSSSRRT